MESLRRTNDRREVERILRRAVFEGAPAKHRTLPPNVVRDLVASEHATPQRALFVIQRVTDRWRLHRAEGKPCNPVAMVIAGFGAQRGGRGKPWPIEDLWISEEWERRSKERAQADALQRHVDALRAQAPAMSPAVRAT